MNGLGSGARKAENEEMDIDKKWAPSIESTKSIIIFQISLIYCLQ